MAANVHQLAPFAHARFCVEHRDQCQVSRRSIRKAAVRLTPERMDALAAVNRAVNDKIRPQPDAPGPLGDRWTLEPARGDCDDYAVTKRARLLKAGWPSRALLLATAILPDGQDHLVLLVRTSSGDVILDNLAPAPRQISKVRYGWTAVQDEADPRLWLKVDPRRTMIAKAPIERDPAPTVIAQERVVVAALGLRGSILR